MTLQELEQQCDTSAALIAISRSQLPPLMKALNLIPTTFCYYYPLTASIILSVKTRADFAPVRALHKGVWEKMPPRFDDNDQIEVRYNAVINGVNVTAYVAELPPSCVLIREEVVVPEHTETRQRITCPEALNFEHGL